MDHSSCVELHSQWVSSLFYSFFMLDARRQVRAKYTGSRRYVLIREHHWIVFSSQIFRLELSYIHFFYFPHLFINIFSFKNSKITFPPFIKGFLSLQGFWKHLVGSFHLRAHFLPFTVHLCFLNLKIPKKLASNFNLLTFLPVESTLTFHCSNLKIRFEELSINFVWYVKSRIQRPHFYAYQRTTTSP